MFGFMRNRHDHEDFIASLDILVPSICSIAVAPSYIRPLILATAFLSPSVRKALKAIEKITQAAKACVIRRCDAIVSGQQPRQDLLQQLLQIRDDKGEKVDFDIPEIQLEAYVAM
jgi:cytochrome P450